MATTRTVQQLRVDLEAGKVFVVVRRTITDDDTGGEIEVPTPESVLDPKSETAIALLALAQDVTIELTQVSGKLFSAAAAAVAAE